MSDFPIAGADAPAFALRDRNGTPLAFGDGESSAPATLLFFFKHDLQRPFVDLIGNVL